MNYQESYRHVHLTIAAFQRCKYKNRIIKATYFLQHTILHAT